jgi:hypothetical protein
MVFNKKIAPMDPHQDAAHRRVIRGTMREPKRGSLIDSIVQILWGVLHGLCEEL